MLIHTAAKGAHSHHDATLVALHQLIIVIVLFDVAHGATVVSERQVQRLVRRRGGLAGRLRFGGGRFWLGGEGGGGVGWGVAVVPGSIVGAPLAGVGEGLKRTKRSNVS